MYIKRNVATSVMTSFIIGSTSLVAASSTVATMKPNKHESSIVFNQNNTKTKTLISPNYLGTSNGTQQNSFSTTEKKSNDFYLVKKELLSYLGLDSNWDYNSAIAPKKTAIETSIKFLKQLETLNFPLPTPMLSSDGEICLYWKKKNFYIEIGFEEEGHFSYAVDNYDKPFGEDSLPIDNFYQTRLYAALSNFSSDI